MMPAPIAEIATESWAALCTRHRRRDIGMSGIRRVRIDVFTRGVAILTYVIDHLWLAEGAEVRSILRLSEPKGLQGTTVLMAEKNSDPETGIWLKLSTAKHVITIEPERATQRVLGTDFTYEDLRFWPPFAALPGSVAAGGSALQFVARRSGHTMTARFDPASASLLEYVESDGDIITKSWIVDEHAMFGRIFSPTCLRVERNAGEFRSVMRLLNLSFDVPLDPRLFRPESLVGLEPGHYAGALECLARNDLMSAPPSGAP